MEKVRMRYGAYKEHYSDCKTEYGSYDEHSKTIIVLVPEGRMKPSGVRGKRYLYLRYEGTERATGRHVEVTVKAMSLENAEKQLKMYYPDCDFITDRKEA